MYGQGRGQQKGIDRKGRMKKEGEEDASEEKLLFVRVRIRSRRLPYVDVVLNDVSSAIMSYRR